MEVKPGYQQTEVGVIPEDWNLRQLGEVITFLDGKRKPVKDADRAKMRGSIPYYGASGIVDYVNDYLFDEDLILLGEDGENILSRNCRLAFRISGKAWVNNHAHVLKPNPDISIGFLADYLESLNYERFNSGTAQPKLNKQTCFGIPVALPPTKTEQEAIAEVLSDADALIESLEQLLAKKRQIKQGAMQELLTGKKRLPGFQINPGYKQTEVGVIPEDWGLEKLENIAEVIDPHPSHRAPPAVPNGIPFVGIGDLNENGDLIGNKIRTVDPSVFDEHLTRYDLNEELIGLGRVASIGKVVKLKLEKTPYTISPTLGVIRGTKVKRDYLLYALKSRLIVEQFKKIMSGSTRSSVGMVVLRQLIICLPKKGTEQEAIAAILFDMDAEIAALEAKLSKARQIKQGMMQELLTGRIRLAQKAAIGLEKEQTPKTAKSHNWQFNEAVVISVLTKHFGSEEFPLGRKRYTKLSYLLHRYADNKTERYLKKAAGPYNPGTRYKGPEKIAVTKGYVRDHEKDKYSGFITSTRIEEAEEYFLKWYGPDALPWLEQFRFKTNDDLGLLTTVDFAIEELKIAGKDISVEEVKIVIRNHPEWKAKLDRTLFSDANLAQSIQACGELFK